MTSDFPISRRALLAGSAACAATSLLAPRAFANGAATGLDALARAKGLRFGTAMGVSDLSEPDLMALIEKDCSILVAENAFKWKAVEGRPRQYSFDRADAIYDYANSSGKALRGHTLVWNQDDRVPDWLLRVDDESDAVRPAIMETLIESHIETMIGRFPRVTSWDVVNEMIRPYQGDVRNTVITHAVSERVMDIAFHKARELAPDTQLAYNDYMSWTARPNHRDGVLRLLEGALGRGVPIDALGIQAHLVNTLEDEVDERGWRAFLDEIEGMGLTVLLTELDCADTNVAATSIHARDRAAADHVKAYLDVTLSYDNVADILLWDMTDRGSYVRQRRYANNRPREDGAELRAHPYDDDLQPKPMYNAIADALRHAPERTRPERG